MLRHEDAKEREAVHPRHLEVQGDDVWPELESEAKKAFELFGDRAQAELKQFLSSAQGSTREQWSKFGAELVKLGHKVQEMAKEQEAAVESAAAKVADEAEKIKNATEVH